MLAIDLDSIGTSLGQDTTVSVIDGSANSAPPRVTRIINGSPTSLYPSVGTVGDATFGQYCTGTLIAPQYVLTAAHCVVDGASVVGDTAGRVRFGTTTYSTSKVIVHPSYNEAQFGTDAANDIAIFKLTAPITTITPSNISRQVPTAGTSLTIVGFGGGGTGNTGSDGSFGTKRVGTTPIDRVSSTLIHWRFDNNTESNTAPGDSGGPAFIDVGGELRVAGVTSGGTLANAAIGDNSYDTRVDVYQAWIDGVLSGTTTTNVIDYVTAGLNYNESFDTLATTGTSAALPSGWVLTETGTNSNTTYTAGTGSGTAGDTYSFGAANSTERALGGLLSGSLSPTFGAAIRNSTGASLTSMTIGYRGEQWRLGTAGRTDRLDFQYSFDATSLTDGTWTDVDSLDFSSPTTSGTVGAFDGNAVANRTNRSATIGSLNVPNNTTFWIRFVDFNASGSDDGLAIDDFVFSATSTVVSNTAPTITTISNQVTAFQTATSALPFTVGDAQTLAANLVVTATSSNTTLVQSSGILLAGSGANRTITLTPQASQSGVSTITVTVSDGTLTTSTSFQLTVNPGTTTTNSTLRIVSYNIAAANGVPRTGYETILQAIGTEVVGGISRPVDLFALQEVESQATTSTIIAASLNNLYGTTAYVSGTINGATSGSGTQGVVYNSQTLQLVGESVVGVVSTTGAPRQTIRHQFRPVGTAGNTDFYVYNSHLKSADTGADEARRLVDVQAIRADADSLGQGANILYVGDFNMFTSNEDGYQRFLSAGNGQAFDPINRPGNWSGNTTFRDIFTQAPSAVAQPSLGLDGGGMDDRLDFQLVSGELNDGVGLEYRQGSYHTFGVNGTVVVNGSIDDASNTALAGLSNRLTVLGLLRTVSDHLPVVADYTLVSSVTNLAPTDIQLTNASVTENLPVGTVVGTLSTIDPNPGDTFTYTLVAGAGSANNASFSIVNNSLRTNAVLDFETTPAPTVRIRATDQGNLSFEKSFVLTVSNVRDASVLARQVFYNRSTSTTFGNGTGNPIESIDTTKVALTPGATSSFANYTNYDKGLNGLVIDIAGTVNVSASDLQFATWNGIDAVGFVSTTAVPTVSLIAGGGVSSSTRVKVEFDNAAIKNTWLRVTVQANNNTDLASSDVFYFGNVIAELNIGNTSTRLRVNGQDTNQILLNQSPGANSVPITNIFDLNRDGRVNGQDTNVLLINQQAGGIVAPITAPLSSTATQVLKLAAPVSSTALPIVSKELLGGTNQAIAVTEQRRTRKTSDPAVAMNKTSTSNVQENAMLGKERQRTSLRASNNLESIDSYFASLARFL